ncbi:outer membrane lipoprotein carrier protein LolA [Flavobacterium zepuense]|uniref:Outer membrane lipoprotein carrier protein LolA n=2 Tax=Flavobacterium zepuense TaxID=2593302 RepID=A0A552V1A1_9FLAO|nr:outer membrane lipoprotein carrier protein LolA [Flavobacterium zepuense]TRW24235.1 outer membrane lipoprotein carrier protein LolA [Flavobacterium zepuense]
MKKTTFSMHKLIRVVSLFILTFSLSLHAQDAAKAKKLLDEVSGKIKSYNNISIDFKYSLGNAKKNLNQECKGNVVLQGNKYVLNFMGVTRIFDGKKVYNIVPEDEEVTISNFDDKKDDGLTPSKMLTFFNSGYKYAWDIVQNVKGRKIQLIKLTPTDSKDNTKEILIGIDSQTKHIYNLLQIDKDGTRTTFTINSFKTNQPLSKNHFTFTESKYPNYYVNKLD